MIYDQVSSTSSILYLKSILYLRRKMELGFILEGV